MNIRKNLYANIARQCCSAKVLFSAFANSFQNNMNATLTSARIFLLRVVSSAARPRSHRFVNS